QFMVSGDDRQQIVEIMRDPAGELPKSFHALDFPYRLLLSDLMADIANDGKDAKAAAFIFPDLGESGDAGEIPSAAPDEGDDPRLDPAVGKRARLARGDP